MKHPKTLLAGTLLIGLTWQACQRIVLEEEDANTDGRTFTFSLYTPKPSRATAMADFQHIIVMDVKGGVVQQVVKQTPADADFGCPTITLTAGTHTLRFFATDAKGMMLTETRVCQEPLGDSFSQTLTINARDAATNQRVVLRRKVAKVIYRGTHEVEVHGALFDFDLLSYVPDGDEHAVTMRKDDAFCSYAPQTGLLRLSDNTTFSIRENSIIVIDDKGITEEPGGGDPSPDEILVWENDTALFYAPKSEITGITLSETPDPMEKYGAQLLPYRMPTRLEAISLRAFSMPEGYWSGARCLCHDREEDRGLSTTTELGTGKYYTFLWGDSSTNGVTAAGEKTPYAIKPIRTEAIEPISSQYAIDADFDWSTDTVKVEYDF